MPKVNFIMEIEKLSISTPELSDEGRGRLERWCLINNVNSDNLNIGDLMKLIVDYKEKQNLWSLLVVWINLGGDLIDILWGYTLDILEGRNE
jgi:hypothetical protein